MLDVSDVVINNYLRCNFFLILCFYGHLLANWTQKQVALLLLEGSVYTFWIYQNLNLR